MRAAGILCGLLLLAGGQALAAWGPGQLAIRGELTNLAGEPVAGPVALLFALYDGPAAPAPVWTESHPEVALDGEGSFIVRLGLEKPLDQPPLFESFGDLWVGVTVNQGSELPRLPLAAVGYSFQARHAVSASQIDCVGCVGSGQLEDGGVGLADLGGGCGPAQVVKRNAGGDTWQCAPDRVLSGQEVVTYVTDAGFVLFGSLAVVAFSGSYQDLVDTPPVLALIDLDGAGNLTVGGKAVIAPGGQWIGDPTGLVGPKGDKGDKGDTGAQGLKGDTGDTGAQGPKGDTGDTGAQGLKGDKGDTGAQGLKGDKGDTGAQGLKGDKGDTGAQGLKGDKGDTGVQGLKGDKGDTGAQGLKGDKGDTGTQGVQGPAGENGGLCYTHWGVWGCASGYTEVLRGNPGGHESYHSGGAHMSNVECLDSEASAKQTWSSGYTNRLMRGDAEGDGMAKVRSRCSICCDGGCYVALGKNTCASGYTKVYGGRTGGVEAYVQGVYGKTLCIDTGAEVQYTWASGHNTRLMRHRDIGGSSDNGMDYIDNLCAVCCMQ